MSATERCSWKFPESEQELHVCELLCRVKSAFLLMEMGHRCQNLEFCPFLASSETGKHHSSCKNSGSRLWGGSCILTWPGWGGRPGASGAHHIDFHSNPSFVAYDFREPFLVPWVLSSPGILLACFSLVSHSVDFYFLKSVRSVNFPLSTFLLQKFVAVFHFLWPLLPPLV